VRILFDQGTPVPLRRSLATHLVGTAYEQGWSTVTNGDLIRFAEAEGYQLLMTTSIAILVLSTTSWPRIKAAAAQVAAVVEDLAPGEVREFTIL